MCGFSGTSSVRLTLREWSRCWRHRTIIYSCVIIVVCIFILLSLSNNIYIYIKYFLCIRKAQEFFKSKEFDLISFCHLIHPPFKWPLCLKGSTPIPYHVSFIVCGALTLKYPSLGTQGGSVNKDGTCHSHK